MRTLLTPLMLFALGLVGFAGAQDDPIPPKPDDPTPAKPADDPWRIKKPESNPTGEPVTLKIAIEPGSGHRLDTSFLQSMETPMGPMKSEIGMIVIMKIISTDENGESVFEMPIEFTKMLVNGSDMVQMIKMSAPNPKVTGKLDAKGGVIPGSTKFEGMGGMQAKMASRFENIMPTLPQRPLRVGEVAQLTPKEYLKALGQGFQGGEIEGEIYQVLEKIDGEEDNQVAHIKTVFSLRVFGDDIEFQPGAKGKGEIRMMGETMTSFGFDGYLRSSTSQMKTEIALDVGIPPMTMELTMTMTGARVKNEVPKKAEPPKETEPAGGK